MTELKSAERGSRLSRATILDIVSFVARFYMAYIWLKAGFSKITDRVSVAQSIEGYDIFSPYWANLLSHLIAPLEIAGGLLLLFGIFLRYSSWVATMVLALFIIGLTQAWARGLVTDCGCFGAEEINPDEAALNYAKAIARDYFYIFLSLWTVYRPYKKFALYA